MMCFLQAVIQVLQVTAAGCPFPAHCRAPCTFPQSLVVVRGGEQSLGRDRGAGLPSSFCPGSDQKSLPFRQTCYGCLFPHCVSPRPSKPAEGKISLAAPRSPCDLEPTLKLRKATSTQKTVGGLMGNCSDLQDTVIMDTMDTTQIWGMVTSCKLV